MSAADIRISLVDDPSSCVVVTDGSIAVLTIEKEQKIVTWTAVLVATKTAVQVFTKISLFIEYDPNAAHCPWGF